MTYIFLAVAAVSFFLVGFGYGMIYQREKFSSDNLNYEMKGKRHEIK